ncbi:Regulation of nuclear pre-mRNA domain-containing protein 1A [Dinochytrium kinnereticum]|nr:Regulation of nuclear pre-mRNA domain-containing protein 1A [Dinochytrium kinnereticum]
MFHRKHAKNVVEVWLKELLKATASRQLSMLYLCNDVVQISKKKHDDFVREFSRVLPEGINHMYRHATADVQNKIRRILAIWEERQVYPASYVQKILTGLGAKPSTTPSKAVAPPTQHQKPESTATPPPTINPELEPIITASEAVKKANQKRLQMERVAAEAPNVIDPSIPSPSSDRISTALTAQTDYTQSLAAEITHHKTLITHLQTLLASQQRSLSTLESLQKDANTKLSSITHLSTASLNALQQPPVSGGMLQALLSNAAAAAGAGGGGESVGFGMGLEGGGWYWIEDGDGLGR